MLNMLCLQHLKPRYLPGRKLLAATLCAALTGMILARRSQEIEAAAGSLFLFRLESYSGDQMRTDQSASQLLRLVGRRLVDVPLAAKPPPFTSFVIADYLSRTIVLGGSSPMPSAFQVVSMDNPGAIRNFEINIPGRHLAVAHFQETPQLSRLLMNLFNDYLFQGNDPKPVNEMLIGFDLSDSKWVDVSPDVYRYARLAGGTRLLSSLWDESEGLLQFGDGRLMMPVAGHVFDIGPPLPLDLRFDPKDGPRMYLNNDRLTAVTNTTYMAGGLRYRVLDKKSNKWIELRVPGDGSHDVRAFGVWMAGMVEENLKGERKPFRLSPGRHKSDRQAVFPTVDEYLEDRDYYRPGILFLYNIETHRYYQWKTHEGDSEVLLIEDNQVYYRVDRAIYRAPIGEKELGKVELLVEDDVIRGVHWAFFSSGVPPEAAPAAIRR